MAVASAGPYANHTSTWALNFFIGRMLFLTPNQQFQSTEDRMYYLISTPLVVQPEGWKIIWSVQIPLQLVIPKNSLLWDLSQFMGESRPLNNTDSSSFTHGKFWKCSLSRLFFKSDFPTIIRDIKVKRHKLEERDFFTGWITSWCPTNSTTSTERVVLYFIEKTFMNANIKMPQKTS